MSWYIPRKIRSVIRDKVRNAAARFGAQVDDFEVDFSLSAIKLKGIRFKGDGWEVVVREVEVEKWKILGFLPPAVDIGDVKVNGVHFQGTVPEIKKTPRANTENRTIKWKSLKVTGLWIDAKMPGLTLGCEDGSLDFKSGQGGHASLSNVSFRGGRLPLYFVNSVDVDFENLRKINKVKLSSLVWKLSRDLNLYTETVEINPEDTVTMKFNLSGHFLPRKGEVKASGSFNRLTKKVFTIVRVSKASAGFLIPPAIPVSDRESVSLDGKLVIRAEGKTADVEVNGTLSGLSLFHKGLAERKISNLSAELNSKMHWNRTTDLLQLKDTVIKHRNVSVKVEGKVEGFSKPKPVLEGRVIIDPVPCQDVLASLPEPLFPNITKFQTRGNFSTNLGFRIDFAHPMGKNGVVLSGGVYPDGCRVLKTPPYFSARRLKGNFGFSMLEPGGQYVNVEVDSDSDWYTPLDRISPHMIQAVLTTEDGRFYRHKGFITSEFSTALAKNLATGNFRYGASSISMQVVKNVFLKRKKTLSRKLEELFLTWYMERSLSKKRIMEIYLNIIELGPNIYGITKASRHFFGKEPAELTPREAIFFASILPSPKKRYVYYCNGAVSSYWNKVLNNLLTIMRRRGRLNEEDYKAAMEEEIKFDHANFIGKSQCYHKLRSYGGR